MKMFVYAGLILVATAVAPRNAHAYLDPGSGSMVMQLLLAGFAGVAVGLKTFWRKLWSRFRRAKPEPPAHPSAKSR